MTQSPKSLYDISLDVFCESLYTWSQTSSRNRQDGGEKSAPLHRLTSMENHPHLNLIFSTLNARPPSWILSSRPSSTDNLAAAYHNGNATGNLDDKFSFKKSCHNLMSTFFSNRRSLESLEEESFKEMAENFHLYFRISENIFQDVMKRYQMRFKINDRILSFPLFDGDVNTITSFQVEDATHITVEGLKSLKKHNLVRLKMANLTNCTITELINNLSPWSIWNLESFSVPHCSLCRFNKICIILSLTRLTHLTHLDMSNTSFNNQCLEIITDHLCNLRSLNLTSTKITILKPLLKLNNLTRLILHNVAVTCKDEWVLGDLKTLEVLDISDERFTIEPERFVVYDHLSEFFPKFFSFERLTELDISGRNVEPADVCRLVKHRLELHKKSSNFLPLRFLGLMLSKFSFSQLFDLDCRTKGKLAITGNGKLIQVIQALVRYRDRWTFINRAVNFLRYYCSIDIMDDTPPPTDVQDIDIYTLCNDFDDDYEYDEKTDSQEILIREGRIRPNEIQPYKVSLVHIVVDIMKTHIKHLLIIDLASGTLYILTRNNPNLHPATLKQVVDICIETISHYPNEYSIIKNILQTLCSERILHVVTFDRYTCIRLVMDTLFTFRDFSVNRLALGICAILTAKIPTVENALMGSHSIYLKRLLDLVQESYSIHTDTNESILKLSLSALWNFTDEAPKTCEMFIKHKGIELYVETLVSFEGKSNIETKILGLLNNIAEVYHLRPHLLHPKLLFQLRKLIYSDHIDVNYFAIGILAQLASDPKLNWDKVRDDFKLDDVLLEMENHIQSWPNPTFEMVAYRSFEPFVSLLVNKRHNAVSLWALWAIHHVCTKNPKKYCRMLYEGKCLEIIIQILKHRLQKRFWDALSADETELICHRLINFVTVVDDEFNVLSKVRTNWNCHLMRKWSILLEPSSEPLVTQECTAETMDSVTPSPVEMCDCYYKTLLECDPFLRLPSIILKSFQCFSPIPLNLNQSF